MKPISLISFEKDSNDIKSLWYYYTDHSVHYFAILTITLKCEMNFEKFPFDSHECIIHLRNWIGSTFRVLLNSIKVLTIDENGNEIGGEILQVNNDMDYNFNFRQVVEESCLFQKCSRVFEIGGSQS